MAKDAADDISYYLLIDEWYKNDLAGIRQWDNIKIGFEGNTIWAKDINYVQINSLQVKSIPYKTIFYASNGKLCLQNSVLPHRNIPSLLWTPIERALPIQLPPFNHNYFGLQQQMQLTVTPSNQEKEAVAVMVAMDVLQQYMQTAPQVRLQNIKWSIVDSNKALLFGKPFLPIKGPTYWQRGMFLLPTGYDVNLHILCDTLNNIINPANRNWVIWDADSSYFLMDKNDLQPLSLSAVRLSMAATLNPLL